MPRHPWPACRTHVSTSVSLCLTIILLLIPHHLQLSSCRFASARSRSSTQRTARALQLPTGLSERSVGSCGASDLGEVSQRRGLGNLPVETPFRLSGSAPLNTLPLFTHPCVVLLLPLPSASVRAPLQYNTQPLVAALPAVVGTACWRSDLSRLRENPLVERAESRTRRPRDKWAEKNDRVALLLSPCLLYLTCVC